MTKTSEKKEQELWYLMRFKESYDCFPDGQIKPNEKPDFMIESDSGLVGIEVTRFFRSQPKGQRPLKEQESLREQIVKRAQSLYSKGGGSTLHTVVHFHPGMTLSKKQVQVLATQLADLVSEIKLAVGDRVCIRHSWDNRDRFPMEIVSIAVYRPAAATKSSWGIWEFGWGSESTPNDIQQIISDKNKLCKTYREKCQVVWLLIVAEDFAPSSTVDVPLATRDYEYQSEFDRVFFFENFKQNVIELNIERTRTAGSNG